MTDPTRIDLLALDTDIRLADLWKVAGEVMAWDLDQAACFMRAAYAKGHLDAVTESDPDAFYLDHGYRPRGRV